MNELPFAPVASQLVRAVRGRRSQQAFSKRLGSSSNVLYLWESGRRFPSASRFLHVCHVAGIDVWAALAKFLRSEPAWLAECRTKGRVPSSETVSCLLNDLKGQRSLVDVARGMGKSRFRVARWFAGATEPRLPDFLEVVHATSFRLLDFVAAFANPRSIPLLASSFVQLEAARQSAFTSPWCHAVLRLLETSRMQNVSVSAGELAAELGLSTRQVRESLELLERTEQVARTERGYRVRRIDNVDLATEPEAVQRLKAWAARIGVERIERGAEGLYSYNLFCVSRKDHERLQTLHRAYFRQVRAIVAESTPSEEVVMMNLQLFKLSR